MLVTALVLLPICTGVIGGVIGARIQRERTVGVRFETMSDLVIPAGSGILAVSVRRREGDNFRHSSTQK